jgi:hypothetical protein
LPVNLTCWTTAPVTDKENACRDSGKAWFFTSEGCYIPDNILMTRVAIPMGKDNKINMWNKSRTKYAELTDLLPWCPQPKHQVASFKEQYSEGTYCYDCVGLECNAVQIGPANGSVELDCYSYGQPVRGDRLWWRWKNHDGCWIPNQAFDAFSFFGMLR